MSVNKLMDIANRSLQAYQGALTATSNNIANAGNKDYSRQRVILTSEPPDRGTGLNYGSGITLSGIQRIRDVFIDSQRYQYNSKQASAEKHSNILAKMETLLSEPSEAGLSNLMNSFFNSFEELSADPTSMPLRNNVLNAAQRFTDKLNTLYGGYSSLQDDLRNEAQIYVNDLNDYLEQIQNLNKEIFASQTRGSDANELQDERTRIINELSQIANITVQTNSDSSVSISIGGIFAADRLHHLEFALEEQNGTLKIVTEKDNVSMSLNGGKLYGTTRIYNEIIPSYLTALDDIGNGIMDNVNTAHNAGYTFTDPPQTSIDFFDSYTNGLLSINQNILDDAAMIAISSDGNDGNNDVALEIAALKDQDLINGTSIMDTYSAFVNDLANEKLLQDENASSFQLVINQLEGQVSEISGVSIDEEMVNVLKYQKSFDAAARLVRVADELMQTLLNAFG